MSHGVKRTRQSAEVQQARRQREQSQLKAYLALSDDVLSRKHSGDLSRESFDATTKLLALNPEFYTIWNYRRTLMLDGFFPTLSPSDVHAMLQSDLSMTIAALRQHPKVYWIWNHRRWCLENIPDGPEGAGPGKTWRIGAWTKELYIAEKMLDTDARNFHAWNYRRYIFSQSPDLRSPQDELAYTKRKIEGNFSNFSAWHQRSKVYGALWEKGVPESEQRVIRDEEFELVKQAMYTDPADQSAWLYHRWLVGEGHDIAILDREIAVIEELLEIEPDSKWCLESLVHYKSLAIAHLRTSENDEPLESLKKECNGMLEKLQVIDPKRRRRYMDMIIA